MLAVPAETPFIFPLSTVAISVLSDFHVIVLSVAFSGVIVVTTLNSSPTTIDFDSGLTVKLDTLIFLLALYGYSIV